MINVSEKITMPLAAAMEGNIAEPKPVMLVRNFKARESDELATYNGAIPSAGTAWQCGEVHSRTIAQSGVSVAGRATHSSSPAQTTTAAAKQATRATPALVTRLGVNNSNTFLTTIPTPAVVSQPGSTSPNTVPATRAIPVVVSQPGGTNQNTVPASRITPVLVTRRGVTCSDTFLTTIPTSALVSGPGGTSPITFPARATPAVVSWPGGTIPNTFPASRAIKELLSQSGGTSPNTLQSPRATTTVVSWPGVTSPIPARKPMLAVVSQSGGTSPNTLQSPRTTPAVVSWPGGTSPNTFPARRAIQAMTSVPGVVVIPASRNHPVVSMPKGTNLSTLQASRPTPSLTATPAHKVPEGFVSIPNKGSYFSINVPLANVPANVLIPGGFDTQSKVNNVHAFSMSNASQGTRGPVTVPSTRLTTAQAGGVTLGPVFKPTGIKVNEILSSIRNQGLLSGSSTKLSTSSEPTGIKVNGNLSSIINQGLLSGSSTKLSTSSEPGSIKVHPVPADGKTPGLVSMPSCIKVKTVPAGGITPDLLFKQTGIKVQPVPAGGTTPDLLFKQTGIKVQPVPAGGTTPDLFFKQTGIKVQPVPAGGTTPDLFFKQSGIKVQPVPSGGTTPDLLFKQSGNMVHPVPAGRTSPGLRFKPSDNNVKTVPAGKTSPELRVKPIHIKVKTMQGGGSTPALVPKPDGINVNVQTEPTEITPSLVSKSGGSQVKKVIKVKTVPAGVMPAVPAGVTPTGTVMKLIPVTTAAANNTSPNSVLKTTSVSPGGQKIRLVDNTPPYSELSGTSKSPPWTKVTVVSLQPQVEKDLGNGAMSTSVQTVRNEPTQPIQDKAATRQQQAGPISTSVQTVRNEPTQPIQDKAATRQQQAGPISTSVQTVKNEPTTQTNTVTQHQPVQLVSPACSGVQPSGPITLPNTLRTITTAGCDSAGTAQPQKYLIATIGDKSYLVPMSSVGNSDTSEATKSSPSETVKNTSPTLTQAQTAKTTNRDVQKELSLLSAKIRSKGSKPGLPTNKVQSRNLPHLAKLIMSRRLARMNKPDVSFKNISKTPLWELCKKKRQMSANESKLKMNISKTPIPESGGKKKRRISRRMKKKLKQCKCCYVVLNSCPVRSKQVTVSRLRKAKFNCSEVCRTTFLNRHFETHQDFKTPIQIWRKLHDQKMQAMTEKDVTGADAEMRNGSCAREIDSINFTCTTSISHPRNHSAGKDSGAVCNTQTETVSSDANASDSCKEEGPASSNTPATIPTFDQLLELLDAAVVHQSSGKLSLDTNTSCSNTVCSTGIATTTTSSVPKALTATSCVPKTSTTTSCVPKTTTTTCVPKTTTSSVLKTTTSSVPSLDEHGTFITRDTRSKLLEKIQTTSSVPKTYVPKKAKTLHVLRPSLDEHGTFITRDTQSKLLGKIQKVATSPSSLSSKVVNKSTPSVSIAARSGTALPVTSTQSAQHQQKVMQVNTGTKAVLVPICNAIPFPDNKANYMQAVCTSANTVPSYVVSTSQHDQMMSLLQHTHPLVQSPEIITQQTVPHTTKISGQIGTLPALPVQYTVNMNGQIEALKAVVGPHMSNVSGQTGTLQTVAVPHTANISGQIGTLQMSGQTGTLQAVAVPQTANISGQIGTLQMSGQTGALQAVAVPQTANISGQIGSLQMSGQTGTLQAVAVPQTANISSQIGTLQMSGQTGTLQAVAVEQQQPAKAQSVAVSTCNKITTPVMTPPIFRPVLVQQVPKSVNVAEQTKAMLMSNLRSKVTSKTGEQTLPSSQNIGNVQSTFTNSELSKATTSIEGLLRKENASTKDLSKGIVSIRDLVRQEKVANCADKTIPTMRISSSANFTLTTFSKASFSSSSLTRGAAVSSSTGNTSAQSSVRSPASPRKVNQITFIGPGGQRFSMPAGKFLANPSVNNQLVRYSFPNIPVSTRPKISLRQNTAIRGSPIIVMPTQTPRSPTAARVSVAAPPKSQVALAAQYAPRLCVTASTMSSRQPVTTSVEVVTGCRDNMVDMPSRQPVTTSTVVPLPPVTRSIMTWNVNIKPEPQTEGYGDETETPAPAISIKAEPTDRGYADELPTAAEARNKRKHESDTDSTSDSESANEMPAATESRNKRKHDSDSDDDTTRNKKLKDATADNANQDSCFGTVTVKKEPNDEATENLSTSVVECHTTTKSSEGSARQGGVAKGQLTGHLNKVHSLKQKMKEKLEQLEKMKQSNAAKSSN